MRPLRPGFLLAAALAACSGAHNGAASSASSAPFPPPLQPCEVRSVALPSGQAVVTANPDGSLAGVTVLGSPSAADREAVVAEARRDFGPLRVDSRVVAHPIKWGLTEYTDACGRPVTPSPPP